jgi:hypothetical protein
MALRNLRPRGERIFFASGDIVEIKHDLPNKPQMLVQSVDKSTMKVKQYSPGEHSDDSDEKDKGTLLGLTCIWFTANGELQKHRFNTKDLQKVELDD